MPGDVGPLLACDGLRWTIGGSTILDGIDLTVATGEFVAVIGPNGAGKTSLFNLVSGTVRPSSGRITFAGHDITFEPPHRRARRGIGRTFQSSTVFPTMTVSEHIDMAVRIGRERRTRRNAVIGAEVLERTGLAHRPSTMAGQLSHGDKRKLEIALLLATANGTHDSRLLLLDEPMAGVSAEEVPELVDVIRQAHRGDGHSVLMVEHHMEVLMALADRVAVMHHGALLATGTPEAVTADAAVQRAYLGERL
ncbi:MAG: ABC transporter ATP-binding protein [Sciscionella sp.]